MNYIKPEVYKGSFTCPHCGTLSQQNWWSCSWYGKRSGYSNLHSDYGIRVGQCVHCNRRSLWLGERMYYPENGNAPFPNPEMPDKVKELYLEAASIHGKSPRGAAALLRLGIQILCKELGEGGENINKDIASLVSKGLPEMIQQSLDTVRVIGNDAVHPGQIDTDDPEIVIHLFNLLNIIVEYMIAMPKKVSGLYSTLPKGKLDYIEERDGRA